MKRLALLIILAAVPALAVGPVPTGGVGSCGSPTIVFVGWLYGLPIFTVLPGAC